MWWLGARNKIYATIANMKRILVVQVRNNPTIRDHDASAYHRVIGDRIVFDVKNVTDHSIHLSHIEEYDGYIVGGSHYMTHEDFEQKDELYELTRYAIDSRKPFLGICFGFEILGEVLEGVVVHDPSRKEFGTYTMYVTPDGRDDPLFEGIGDSFLAQEAHESFLRELPANCVHLVRGDNLAIQAMRYGTAHIYGVQFHPELSQKNMHERMGLYNEDDTTTLSFTPESFDLIKDSSESEKIITNFIHMI